MPPGRLSSDRRHRGGHASASSLMEDCQKCSSCCCCCLHSDLSLLNERFFILGVIQLLCGAISIVITVFAVLQKVCLYTQGTGAWAGAFMIAAGILGIVCARRKTVCAVVTLLVLSVLAAIAATLQSTFSIRGLLLEVQNQCEPNHATSPATILAAATGSSQSVVAAVVTAPRPANNFRNYVIHALLLIFGLLEMGVAVTHAVLSGRLICCQTLISVPVGGAGDAGLVGGHRQRPAHLNLLGSHHVILADPALHSAVSGGHGGAAVAAANVAADRRRTGAFVFVMPSPSSAEPTLIFPTPPPPYNGGERQSLIYAADSLLQPAVIVSEEPPEYATVDPRRSRHNHDA